MERALVSKARIIAASLLSCSLLSWIVAWVVGDLTTRALRWMYWPYGVFGLLAGLAGWAYLSACVVPAGGWAQVSWKTLLGAACAIHVTAALALPFTSSDLWSNVANGRMIVLGYNPFVGGPATLPAHELVRALVHPLWLALPSPYGPLIGLFSVGPGCFATPWVAMIVFKCLMAAATWGAVVLAARFCQARLSPEESRERFVLFAWCPLLAWELSGQAHNDAVLLPCLIGFVWAATSKREVTAVACLTLGVAAKFAAVPIAGLYLLSIVRRAPLRGVLLGVGLVAVTVASMLPWWQGTSTLRGLWINIAPVAGHSTRSLADLIGLIGELHSEAWKHQAFRAFSTLGMGVSAALAVVCMVRSRTAVQAIHYALLFLLCGDLFSQAWFQPWYVTWVMVLALGHPDVRWLRLMAPYASLQLLTYALPIDPVTCVALDLYIGIRVIKLAREGAPADPVQARLSAAV